MNSTKKTREEWHIEHPNISQFQTLPLIERNDDIIDL